MWFEDASAPDGVGSIDSSLLGDKIGPFEIFGLDHNVLSEEESWGYDATSPGTGCTDCHRPESRDAPFIDKLILLDPFGADGLPGYSSVREMTGLNPP